MRLGTLASDNDIAASSLTMGEHLSGGCAMIKYLVAILLPPVALLMIGKPFQFILNFSIWLISIPLALMFGIGIVLWLMCIAHAVEACVEHDRVKHERQLVPPSH
jgi:hypothetical protein